MNILFVFIRFALMLILSGVSIADDKVYTDFINQYGQSILNTYRLPAGDDLSYWGTNRDSYFYKVPGKPNVVKAPYWASGLFNNDDITDYVYILFRINDNKAFLVCFLSIEGDYESYVIGGSSKTRAVHTDLYENIKAKVKLLKTSKNIIQHFHLEGHGEIIYWDENEKKFKFYY